MKLLQKLALVAAPALASASAFAVDDTVTVVQTAVLDKIIATNAFAVAVGLGIIGLTFIFFTLRKGKNAANGRIG